MLKKIISFAIVTAIVYQTAASAYELKFNTEIDAQGNAFALIYDEYKKLEAVELCDVTEEDGIYRTELSKGEGKKIKLFLPSLKEMIDEFLEEDDNETEKPVTETTEILPTDSPDKITDEAVSSVYPAAMDAATAYMMVKEVEKIAEEDDIKIKLTVFFQGKEKTLILEEDKVIDYASDMNYALAQESVTSLKAGDIIYCSTNLSGKIRTLELIYRPVSYDIITDERNYGDNFEKLYTIDGKVSKAYPTQTVLFGGSVGSSRVYAFGLIRECGANYMTLCNKSGLVSKCVDIDIDENTIVYVYDSLKKNGNVRIGDISDLVPSAFSAEAEDDAGNIIDMDNYFEHNYALARICDGTATEIAVYLNY